MSTRWDGAIVAYDEATGSQLWRYAVVDYSYGDVVAPGNGIFYVDQEHTGAIEAHRVTDGSLLWSVPSANGGLAATTTTVFATVPVTAGHTVYDVTAAGQIIGMDAMTGAVTYQSATYYPTSHDIDGQPSAPAVADNLIVVPEGNTLVAVQGT